MKENILLGGNWNVKRDAKGFAAPIQLVVIMTVIFAGLLVLLGTWSGSTPIYYQNLPESKFGDLLMSYGHVKENVEMTIEQDSEKMFANMGDFPLDWEAKLTVRDELDPKKNKDICTGGLANCNPSDYEWSEIYNARFTSASGKYFDSVKNLGFEWITIDFKGSSMAYCTGDPLDDSLCKADPTIATTEKPKLIWRFVYRLELQNVIPKNGVVNRINSTEIKTQVYSPFINLNDAKDCAKEYFVAAASPGNTISFGEDSEYFVKEAISQKLNSIAQDSNSLSGCQNFDLSTEIFTEDLCDLDKCSGGNMKDVSYILYIKGKADTPGGISFMNKFSNFGSELLNPEENLKKCTTGKICGVGKYCVKGVCGKCYAGLEGEDCSPLDSPALLGSYKCYQTFSGSYECLEKKEGFYINYLGSKINSGRNININCALKKDALVLEGFGPAAVFSVYLNQFEIIPATGSDGKKSINLCDTDKVPQASGPLEIYLSENGDKYKVYGASVVYALDTCISGISKNLDGFVYSFGKQESGKAEVPFPDLKKEIKQSVTDKIGSNPCEGYDVSVQEIPLSCGTSCADATKTTTWAKEKYSTVTIEIKETGAATTTLAVASPRYIISYTP